MKSKGLIEFIENLCGTVCYFEENKKCNCKKYLEKEVCILEKVGRAIGFVEGVKGIKRIEELENKNDSINKDYKPDPIYTTLIEDGLKNSD